MAPEIKSVELLKDVTLQYAQQGNPSGTPVLLLHGLSDSWHSFERVLPHLPESIRAFALTQRGHGDASRPAAGYRPCTLLDFGPWTNCRLHRRPPTDRTDLSPVRQRTIAVHRRPVFPELA